MSSSEFVERALRDRTQYRHSPIRWIPEYYYFQAQPPQSLEDSILKSAAKAVQPQNLILRVNIQQSIHGLHYDKYGTGLIQLAGHKSISLVPQHVFDKMQYVPHGPFARRSSVDLQNQTVSRSMQALTLQLHPGDMLLFPPAVGHESRSLTDGSTVSFWYP